MKPITKVFLIIGTLILCILIWAFVFNPGGIVSSAWNAMADGINNAAAQVFGKGTKFVPSWSDDTNLNDAEDGASGFGGGTGGGGATS